CAETLPQGQAVALIEDSLAFDEDCRRAVVVVTRLTAPRGCRAAVVLDDRRLAETGAVGLTIDEAGTIAMTTDRSVGEDRPWSPAPQRPRDDRIERPGATGVIHADPADPSIEPADPR
ncbi:MAG TPA: competence protein ComEC, partial [Roseiarcus sp.]|nr:competence protein ComEC [Roseiarcus sp.]